MTLLLITHDTALAARCARRVTHGPRPARASPAATRATRRRCRDRARGDWLLALRLGLRDLRGGGRSFVVLLRRLTLGRRDHRRGRHPQPRRADGRSSATPAPCSAATSSSSRPTRRSPRPSWRAGSRRGRRSARRSCTNTLATGASGRSVSVSLKAVDGAYPLVGAGRARPAHAAGPGARGRWRRGRAHAPGPARHRASATASGSATPTVRITAVLVREPDRVGGLFGFGPRTAAGAARHARRGPGAAAGRAGPLRVPAGPAAGHRRRRRSQPVCSALGPMPAGGRAARATCSRRSPGSPTAWRPS